MFIREDRLSQMFGSIRALNLLPLLCIIPCSRLLRSNLYFWSSQITFEQVRNIFQLILVNLLMFCPNGAKTLFFQRVAISATLVLDCCFIWSSQEIHILVGFVHAHEGVDMPKNTFLMVRLIKKLSLKSCVLILLPTHKYFVFLDNPSALRLLINHKHYFTFKSFLGVKNMHIWLKACALSGDGFSCLELPGYLCVVFCFCSTCGFQDW